MLMCRPLRTTNCTSAPLHCTSALHLRTAPLHCTSILHPCTAPPDRTSALHLCTAPLYCTSALHLCTAPLHCTHALQGLSSSKDISQRTAPAKRPENGPRLSTRSAQSVHRSKTVAGQGARTACFVPPSQASVRSRRGSTCFKKKTRATPAPSTQPPRNSHWTKLRSETTKLLICQWWRDNLRDAAPGRCTCLYENKSILRSHIDPPHVACWVHYRVTSCCASGDLLRFPCYTLAAYMLRCHGREACHSQRGCGHTFLWGDKRGWFFVRGIRSESPISEMVCMQDAQGRMLEK